MAAITTVLAQAAVPPQLLEHLAPNDPISHVSIWPLAIGYWLILALAVFIIASSVFYWLRNKRVRLNLQQLNKIKKSPPQTHCNDVHLLLRAILQQHNAALACMSEHDFSHYVMTSLQLTHEPEWLNAHYRTNTPINMPWIEIRKLVKQWTKEVSL